MNKKHIHFIGIKGVAMTALAIVAKERGNKVTGSDLEGDFPTSEVLKKFKINPLPGFKKENLNGRPDLVVVTGAHHGLDNPEAMAAQKMGLRVLMHGQALAEFMEGKQGICVSGSHGKTTVAAMIAYLLLKNGLDPSFAVGCGDIKSLGAPGHAGRGAYFVAEADEYATDPGRDPTPRFFWLNPQFCVITNIEYDHPDVFANLNQLKQAFLTFGNKLSDNGLLVAGIDNENVKGILPLIKKTILTYGFSPLADYRISRVTFGKEKTRFWLKFKDLELGQFSLSLPGKFNALNATAAMIVANNLGVSWEKIRVSLSKFSGTKRRFEKMREKNGIIFFDDYAHHPSQIKNTLQAVRDWYPQARIIGVFQPHTFSRTKALFNEFAKCFNGADLAVVTDIYPSAREKVDLTVNSHLLVNEAQKFHPNMRYFPTLSQAAAFLVNEIRAGDIMISMGAGDIYKIHEMLYGEP